MKKYTHVVWDWNGTLFDDLALCLHSINLLLGRHGLPALTMERYQQVFQFPIQAYYQQIGFDFTQTPFAQLAIEYMDIYQPASMACKLRKGADDTLNCLAGRNIVLSASKKEYLLRQIEVTGISHQLERVYGIGDIHAASKEALVDLLRADYPEGVFLFVGDTPHDVLVARRAGADCVLLLDGHKDEQALLATGCPVLADIRLVIKWMNGEI